MATQADIERRKQEIWNDPTIGAAKKAQMIAQLDQFYKSQAGNQNLGSAAPATHPQMQGVDPGPAPAGLETATLPRQIDYNIPPQYSSNSVLAGGTRVGTQGGPGYSSAVSGGIQNGAAVAQNVQNRYGSPTTPTQAPGNNLTNPGYTEQAFDYVQNRLLEDPAQAFLTNAAKGTTTPGQGEQYMGQNLGSLDGPGMGEQYWNQVQGQYMSPFAGEQFARQATQNFSAQGPASAFYNDAMGKYGDAYMGYNTQNAQGQYGQSSQQLANGTRGEQGLGQIAGDYGSKGTYSGANNALGQYQQNASSGPMAAQSFYDQVGGSYDTMGKYSDPNLAAGQYAQTQQAFGDLPIANFDPFFDRAIQLGTQQYNQGAAGRGVYGSSEALNGVGNIITDLNAQRALKSFDAEMQRAQEQRARQQLLGEQARMGDLSSLAAFDSNLKGLSTFGDLANQAGNQTIAQQTMLGNQARDADLSATDAFRANLEGATTFANINNQLASQELGRHELLGNMANSADAQNTAAQNARTSALNAFAGAAQSADTAETSRFNARTGAMAEADRNQLARMNAGADIAFRGDESRRADYDSSMNQARLLDSLGQDRTRLGADLMNTASQNDLARLNNFMANANIAESDRQGRMQKTMDAISGYSQDVQQAIMQALGNATQAGQADWENSVQTALAPVLQQAGLSRDQAQQLADTLSAILRKAK